MREGEIFGIAGVDGNGQKQLAEALAGQRAAEAGRVVLNGEAIEGLSVRQRQHAGLRYVTDDRLGEGTVSSFPVSLNLLLKRIGDAPFWQNGIIRNAEVDRHARTLIAEHDVRVPGPGTPLGHLSGGNVQKALLARELDNQPMSVIYNKPTYGLDLNNIRRARRRSASAPTRVWRRSSSRPTSMRFWNSPTVSASCSTAAWSASWTMTAMRRGGSASS